MGILIKNTSNNETDEIYARASVIQIEKHLGNLNVWVDYNITASVSASEENINLYNSLPPTFSFPLTSSKEVRFFYENVVSRSISFIDFDESGSQFTNQYMAYESTPTSSLQLKDDAIDFSAVNNNVYGFTYLLIKGNIKELLPNSIIEDIM